MQKAERVRKFAAVSASRSFLFAPQFPGAAISWRRNFLAPQFLGAAVSWRCNLSTCRGSVATTGKALPAKASNFGSSPLRA
jgi:hypothetical protein